MLRALLLIAAILTAGLHGAQAATAIFYSEPDETYGWAAGYGYAKAEARAQSECQGSGGKTCRFAIECGGGWGAVAISDDSATGAAFACGFTSSGTARGAALGVCMQATRAMCWTESAFDGNGNTIAAAKNDQFDMVWYAQFMLIGQGFLDSKTILDGTDGPLTRSGVKAFQTKIGLPADGKITIDLVWRLLNGEGGPQELARRFGKAYAKFMPEWENHLMSFGTTPVPATTYSEALATYSRDEQLLGLATILQLADQPCTLPARDAEAIPPDGSGGWHVMCDGADYTMLLNDDSVMTLGGLRPIRIEGDNVLIDPPPGDASESSAPDDSSSASSGDPADADPWSMIDEAIDGDASSSAMASSRADDGSGDSGGNWSGSK